MSQKHILVLGSGSAGKRHMRNFASLGCRISAMDPRRDRLEEAAGLVELANCFTTLDEALRKSEEFDGIVVASPPKYHVPQCIEFLKLSIPVLLEKPVATDLADAIKLKDLDQHMLQTKLLVGYTYRWWPPIDILLQKLQDGHIGKPLYADFVMSAHLADWHPWEKYQDFFMSSKDLGGGALLDESHFIDLMIRFFGMPSKIFATIEHLSSLEIETDDNVDILAFYDDNFRVRIHLDLYGRPHEKYIKITSEKGTLFWSFEPNMIKMGLNMNREWQEMKFQIERNDMFLNMAKDFIHLLNGHKAPLCTFEDGLKALHVIEACRRSSADEKPVYLNRLKDGS
ncbi:Gfo/Idh/MocA family oxidoreductase [Paenibacillus sp. sptzw28]|uniref:Gfo/Idh/MocA family protein n=1 Tax=Paenibacillus sp. sptzw28 TaxID=715179 RepID=UPI001C6EE9CE|nr:Gfo/Idh/MocA family oxidoreductase [Paenibacillus sp. sptzw28]QYR19842.1 Gfo/Idh/MocA family oxidoreductase [Paenibacillus sp. sptzw28]